MSNDSIQEDHLPTGWCTAPLSDVVDILDSRRKPVNRKERALRIGNVPYYGATGRAGWIDDYLFNEELVLLGEDAAPFFDKSKHVAYRIEGEAWVNNHAHVLRGKNGVVNRYLVHALNWVDYKPWVSGTTRYKLPQGEMKQIPLWIPPTAEQERIADRIEELFTDLDAGIAALERVKRNLTRYRAAVLHAAVTGRLTEEWRKEHGPPEEPASELLERILEERRKQWEEKTLAGYEAKGKKPPKNWKGRYKEPELSSFEDRETLPINWQWATVEQLTRGDRDSAYGVLVPGPDVHDGIPMVRVGDIQGGAVDTQNLKRINPEIASKFKRTFLSGGELLMSLVGSIGRTAIAPAELKGANTARAVGVIPLSELVVAEYVEFWFRNPSRIGEMTKKSHEVARKTLNLEDVRATLVALPPHQEQIKITELVSEKLSQIDAMESEVNRGLSRSNRLRQAILKAAFEGKLVSQDPNDEPASVLLERIREQTAKAPKTKRKTRKKSSRKAATT